jgi:hypothetical protein
MAAGRHVRAVLLDGTVCGIWTAVRRRSAATLQVRPFVRLTRRDRAALTEEGTRLLAFVEPDTATRDVLIATA